MKYIYEYICVCVCLCLCFCLCCIRYVHECVTSIEPQLAAITYKCGHGLRCMLESQALLFGYICYLL